MDKGKVEIVINNSYSHIRGLTVVGFKDLQRVLSYEVDPQSAYFSGSYRPRRKSLLSAKGEFPTGLLHRVYDFCLDNRIEAKVTETSTRPPDRYPRPTKLKHTLYPDQLDAINTAQEAGRGIISMPTGSGKSLVIAMLVARLGLRTLVVVPSLEIKKQLTETILETLGGLLNVTIENIDSAKLKVPDKYDCLIIDEAHHSAAKTYHKLNKTAWTGIYYRFFLTATPFRNQTNEQLLFEAIAGKIIYQLSYKDAISKQYIVPVDAFYKNLPKTPTNAFTWAEVYSQLVVNNDFRNGYIAGTLEGLKATGKSTLCLVKEIKHGEILSQLTGIPFANGQDEDSRDYIRQFNSGGLTALIGTTGVLGEGVDTKPCEYVIIAGLGKAKSAFLQQIGRGVRTYAGKESCKVILFRDSSHKFCLRHFREQCKILKDEFGVKAEEI